MFCCSGSRYTVLANKGISVPSDAAPCCPQRSHPTPVSYSSEPFSQVSTPIQTERPTLVDMDNNFFSLESTDSSSNALPDCIPMELIPLQDETTSTDLVLGHPDQWNSSGHELGSMFSPQELNDMTELDGPGFHTSSSNLELGAAKGGLDSFSSSLDPGIGDWGMALDGNVSMRAIAPPTDGRSRAHSLEDEAKHVVVRHSHGGGEGKERAGSVSRITITIDDAELETMTGVMQVLVQSRARVEFHREGGSKSD
jgi:hypothetical protein